MSREAYYVIADFGRFMTKNEKFAHKQLHAAMKATCGRSDSSAQEEAQRHRAFSSLITTDLEVLQLTEGGHERFVERTAQRILAEHKNEVFLNYCPQCHELARTPRAKQCRFCRYDWHFVKQHA